MKNTFIYFLLTMSIILSCQDKKAKETQKEKTTPEIPQNVDQEANKSDKKLIVFFGNSLTAGYGLDKEQAFPSLIQDRIDSLGLNYTVVNAGLSGETTSGGKERIDWVLRDPADIFVLELGANDMLRGLDLEETEKNLALILDAVIAKNKETKIILAGMYAPPNMGKDYTEKFASIYPKLANKYNTSLIPFFLDGVAGISTLNLEDRKHPNAKGQKIVMENVWKSLEPLL